MATEPKQEIRKITDLKTLLLTLNQTSKNEEKMKITGVITLTKSKSESLIKETTGFILIQSSLAGFVCKNLDNLEDLSCYNTEEWRYVPIHKEDKTLYNYLESPAFLEPGKYSQKIDVRIRLITDNPNTLDSEYVQNMTKENR